MKVLPKILVAPSIAIVFLMLLGAVGNAVLRQQSDALDDMSRTRMAAYQVASESAQEIAEVHSNVYRLITWMTGLKEDVVRKTAGEQKARTEKIEARLTAFGIMVDVSQEERALVQLAIAELGKYRKSVLSAIDLSSGDTLTGATAMQLADKQFQATLKDFDDLVKLEKKLSQE